jgi:hypothetical protein
VRSTSEDSSFLASITDSGRILHAKGYKLGVVDRTSDIFIHIKGSKDQDKALLSHLHRARHSLRLGDMNLADLNLAALGHATYIKLNQSILVDKRWGSAIKRYKAFLIYIRHRQDADNTQLM